MLNLSLLIAFTTGVCLLALLCWSIAVPRQRVWPPPEGRTGCRFWLVWSLIGLLVAATVMVGVLDFGSLGLIGWGWRVAGLALLILGNGLVWWGVTVLGAKPTTGLAGDLVTDGPYRGTRNPQYVGDILIIAGFVLTANSWLAAWPSLLAVASALAAPFAEEPRLRARFGNAYVAYEQRVPRFIGRIACRPKSP